MGLWNPHFGHVTLMSMWQRTDGKRFGSFISARDGIWVNLELDNVFLVP